MVSTMAREKLKLNPTPLDKLLLVSLLPMPMPLDTPSMLDTLPMSLMDLDMVMVFTMAREKLKLSQNPTPLDKLLLVSLSIMHMPLATHTMLDTKPYTLGQVAAGLPVYNAYATGHPHNVGYTAYVSLSIMPMPLATHTML